jgi:hypothetical protein
MFVIYILTEVFVNINFQYLERWYVCCVTGDMPEDALGCHLCDHVAHDTTHLEQHLALVHEKDVTYKCGICGFICQLNKDYYSHMKTHFQGPPFKCDTCKLK